MSKREWGTAIEKRRDSEADTDGRAVPGGDGRMPRRRWCRFVEVNRWIIRKLLTLTRAILERGQHLFLLTDGTLIRRRLHMIPPYTNFFWNVKLDGTEDVHDARADRTGLFAEALDGVKAAKNAGFFVVVTSTVYPDSDMRDAGRVVWRTARDACGWLHAGATCTRGRRFAGMAARNFTRRCTGRFREIERRIGRYII